MGMISEFKEFALKGNLVDIAVGMVMGAAFGKITTAFVDGMVMPLVGQLIGGVDFSSLKWILTPGVAELKDATGKVVTPAIAEVAVSYGAFIVTLIDFLVVAMVMFMVIKAINKAKNAPPPAPAAPPEPTATEKLLTEIRDSLKR
ncbi:MAG: large-conductance mechanosensitive channel protein MscL [Sphingobacteriales bacterium]|nr:large-conductance mechanosensitive channel protein MscL [Sphingobacteriales bacterium]MBP9140793.1 large-conductance mechanosensitive channel protein MscL [Chitinophagales bacterium]MDA0199424.1 large-conductance mechanosensitive channel protein MscL [Bacteroidota bacterium]MBK6889761.1 large-conductance mechanosensitive channel protein MscL [Sphingobacteriales bacterium]MBK7527725.1 large-conductance mechanosensitive channel protein MscL [Sphingobacteriales bacterium]